MKTTKLSAVLIYVLAILTISISSFAQDKESKTKRTPEERAKITSERLKSTLNLTDDQSSKIYDLNLQRFKDRKEFKEDKSKMGVDRKKKGEEYRNTLKSILTEEQFETMKKMHKDKKSKKEHKNKKDKNKRQE